MVAVAIGGAALVGAAGSVAASKSNSKAISKSTDSSLQANRESIAAQQQALNQQLAFQTNALNQGNAFQQQAYNSSGQLNTDVLNRNVSILQPYSATGTAAMNSRNALLGLPEQQAYTPQDLKFKSINVAPITAPASPTPAGTIGPTPQPNNALSNPSIVDAIRAQNMR